MDRLAYLLVILSLISGVSPAARAQTQTDSPPPNVLFILADDLNTTLTSYGAKGVHTPNIDRLAEMGLCFERAYTQAPVCNPSRAALMTGKRTNSLGIWNNEPHFRGIFPRIITLPQAFKQSGYHTIGIGKVFHNWAQAIQGDPRSWSEPQRYHWAPHYQDWYVPGKPYRIQQDLSKGPAVQRVAVEDEAYLDGRIANEAIQRLRELRGTPFFMAVGFWKPHLPYNAPARYWDLYDPDDLPEVRYSDRVRGVPELAYNDSDEAKSYTDVARNQPIPEAKYRELRHGYFACISFLDAQIGKLLDELEALGLMENTIVVFTSDHGYHAGEHGQFGKWTHFEIGTRVPLFIAAPGADYVSSARTTSLVEHVDLYPTLLELCGLAEKAELDGTSLVPILEDPSRTVKSYAYAQIARPIGSVQRLAVVGSSVRSQDYRYTSWRDESTGKVLAEELYDLSQDLWNAKNLAQEAAWQSIRQQLADTLRVMTVDRTFDH
ncbi:MAG: sulfatase [Bacteroidota bacterium]